MLNQHYQKYNKSFPQSFWKSASPPLMIENALVHCMCYLCNVHCIRVQSLSCGYAISTPHRQTHTPSKTISCI